MDAWSDPARVLRWLLPASSVEAIEGDLQEEGIATSWREVFRVGLPIVLHYQFEAYRDSEDRLSIALLGLLALGVLWIVRAATDGTPLTPEIFPHPFLQLVMAMWSMSHLTASVAAGLIIGRLPVVPDHARRARWHLGVLVAGVCVAASGMGSGLWLIVGLWIGASARLGDFDVGQLGSPDQSGSSETLTSSFP